MYELLAAQWSHKVKDTLQQVTRPASCLYVCISVCLSARLFFIIFGHVNYL